MVEYDINNTIFTGKLLIHKKELASTNQFAKELIAKTEPIDGTVIITDSQTAGKGQGSNVWQSDSNKNLTFSIIYNTKFLPAVYQFYLSMAISNGIIQALCKIDNSSFAIKWPNDIIANNKKLGGILIENTIAGNNLKHSIIGIGLNVLQQHFDNLPHATSLSSTTNADLHLPAVLNKICKHIELAFLELKAGKYESIHQVYLQHLYKRDKTISIVENQETIEGKVIGVTTDGELVLQHADTTKLYSFGSVKWQYG